MYNSISGLTARYSDPVVDGMLQKMVSMQTDLAMKLVRINTESKIEAQRMAGIGEIIDTFA